MQMFTTQDIIAITISFLYVFVVIGLMLKLKQKYPTYSLRKVTHMSMGIWPLLWLLYETQLAAILVPAIVTILLAGAPEKMRKIWSEGDEKHIGLVIYAFSFTWVTAFFWKTIPGAAAIFCLAFGDGAGGYFGKKYGKHVYHVPWVKPKTIEGSLAVFAVSVLMTIFAQLLYGNIEDPLSYLLGGLIIGTVSAIAEAISPKHSDNLFIPIAVIAVGGLIYIK
ncbi:MAG: diacylglycerol/polyprenol kinase family protein [Candidatus Njordarchaeia archaeon]|nr:hypothetical protein [Candidatus Korarchaeota archaeon]